MRSNSLGGTRPANTSASVPRLTAPKSARTRTSPAFGGASGSWRSSACPGPLYQSAWAISSVRLIVTFLLSSPDWTLGGSRCYIPEFALSDQGLEAVTSC